MSIPINNRKELIPEESLTSLGIIYQAVLFAMMENSWIFIDDFGGGGVEDRSDRMLASHVWVSSFVHSRRCMYFSLSLSVSILICAFPPSWRSTGFPVRNSGVEVEDAMQANQLTISAFHLRDVRLASFSGVRCPALGCKLSRRGVLDNSPDALTLWNLGEI